MPDVLVGVGSNADPARALRVAEAGLLRAFAPVRFSAVYASAAQGAGGADYWNAVAAFATRASIGELRAALHAIEVEAGRTRDDPRVCVLDLDLLFYGCRVDAFERVPRAGAFVAPFVVVPLAELVPDLVHPLTGEVCAAAARRVTPGALRRLGRLDALA